MKNETRYGEDFRGLLHFVQFDLKHKMIARFKTKNIFMDYEKYREILNDHFRQEGWS